MAGLQAHLKALVAVAVRAFPKVLLLFVDTCILEFVELSQEEALLLGAFERFSDVTNSILPLTTGVAGPSFASAPTSEQEVALGSIPAALVPLNTSTLGPGVTFHLALTKVGGSSWPSCLMDVAVVSIYAEVGVFGV